MTRKSYGDGFDAAVGATDRTRFTRWFAAENRVPRRT